MDCETFHGLLGDWLDGRHDEPTVERMLVHERACPDCDMLHRTRLQLRALVRAANADEALPHFVTRILEKMPKARTR